ncbi:Rim20p [Saccharomyces eubayanus]|uniref:Rim20p n=1 Tax=Saccharomyces eubayanus TaxID=1080349 RepID=UPI0006C2DDEF|nr:RIM20-like protein [Saccharomyces eubayanus]KOG96756.1 RIM20-like protein [Saccharomyces eubayanus]
MSELLGIPLKRTLEVDFVTELSKLIDATSFQTASFFQSDISKVAAARNNAITPDISDSGLDALKKYYAILLQLEKKFPNNQIEFKWFQTLSQKSHGCGQYSLQWEKLTIIYNIGCMYSLLALDSNSDSAESLKKSCLYFQNGAGCFKYVLDHQATLKTETVVDDSTAKALTSLMLAQAQECFWFKAVQDKHKDSLIAKLSQQIVDFYAESIRDSQKGKLIRNDWTNHLKAKKAYFDAVTYYRMALSFNEKKQFGSMVKALQTALKFVNESTLSSNAKFKTVIESALKEAQRDNDFIYLQQVPTELPTIQPASMVKPTPTVGLLPSIGDSELLFKDLIPIEVMDYCTAYNERQDKYIEQRVTNPLTSLNKLLKESMTTFQIPQEIKTISETELKQYQASLNNLQVNNKNIQSELDNITNILNEEALSDNQLRLKHGTLHWTLPESSTINAIYYDKLNKLKEYINQGSAIDKQTNVLFQTIDKALITSEIKLPVSNDPLTNKIKNVIQERSEHIEKTKRRSSEYRILPKIISSYKKSGTTDFEPIFIEHLKYFDEDLRYVDSTKQENMKLIHEIQFKEENTTNKNGVETKKMERTDPRELYIEDLKYSLRLLEEVKDNLNAGTTFYENLINSTNTFCNEVREFDETRRIEKTKLDESLILEGQ